MSSPNLIDGKVVADFSRLDGKLVLAAVTLLVIGLIMIASASMDIAARFNGDPYFYIYRHGIFVGLGLITALMVLRLPVEFWHRNGWLLLSAAMLLLLAVLLPGIGKTVNGSTRWIGLGVLNLQASEVAKLCLVVYLASYLDRRIEEVKSGWWGFLKPMLVMMFAAFFLLLEPDFGATVVIGCAFMGMIFLSGARLSQFALLITGGLLAVAALILSQPYRLQRLTGYTDPWANPFGSGYQLTQSLIAFGRGQWFGVGLGNSIQKQFFLPEAHTDFVFAILAEEFGLLGTLIIIALFAFLVYRIFRIAMTAMKANQLFASYLAFGISIILGVQAFINLGVNMGLLPTKGLTLPLVSYGGSSLIVTCAMVAIVLRIGVETSQQRNEDSKVENSSAEMIGAMLQARGGRRV